MNPYGCFLRASEFLTMYSWVSTRLCPALWVNLMTRKYTDFRKTMPKFAIASASPFRSARSFKTTPSLHHRSVAYPHWPREWQDGRDYRRNSKAGYVSTLWRLQLSHCSAKYRSGERYLGSYWYDWCVYSMRTPFTWWRSGYCYSWNLKVLLVWYISHVYASA